MRRGSELAFLTGARGFAAAGIPFSLAFDSPTFSLRDAAQTLLAVEYFMANTPKALALLAPGFGRATSIAVLESITHQSPFTENMVLKLFFGSKRGMEKNLKQVSQRLHLKSLADIHPFLPWIVIGGVVVGACYLSSNIKQWFYDPPKTAESNPLGFSHNTVILVGDGTKFTAGDVVALVDAATLDKRTSAENTVRLLRTANIGGSNGVKVASGKESVAIPPVAIAEIPTEMPAVVPEESTDYLTNQTMSIRAMDFDSNKKGWAIVIHGVYDKRIPLHLSDDISAEPLRGRTLIRGDVTVQRRYDPSANSAVPYMATLTRIAKNDDENLIPSGAGK